MTNKTYKSPLPKIFKTVKRNENGCWIWCGFLDRCGIPRMSDKGRMRLVKNMLAGHIGKDQTVKNTCGNKRCVNPEHLIVMDKYSYEKKGVNYNTRPRLNHEKAAQIRQLFFEKGWTNKKLAIKYEVTPGTISNITAGRYYK